MNVLKRKAVEGCDVVNWRIQSPMASTQSSSSTSTATTNTITKAKTVEYIKPSRRSLQEYADFFSDESIAAAAAASYQPDLLSAASSSSLPQPSITNTSTASRLNGSARASPSGACPHRFPSRLIAFIMPIACADDRPPFLFLFPLFFFSHLDDLFLSTCSTPYRSSPVQSKR